jgi:hypothetical protein
MSAERSARTVSATEQVDKVRADGGDRRCQVALIQVWRVAVVLPLFRRVHAIGPFCDLLFADGTWMKR